MYVFSARLLATTLVALLVSSCASQQKPPSPEGTPPHQHGAHAAPSFEELLHKMDSDKDGRLSRQEVEGPLSNDFKKIDNNSNGYISSEEFEQAAPPNHHRPESSAPRPQHSGNTVLAGDDQHPVDPALFVTENLLKAITKKKVILSNGIETLCYQITVKSVPQEHEMGPWCPAHTNDTEEQGGIWFEDGHVYDVDGHFLAHIDEFYSDPKWALYRDDGSIKVTKTKEECEAAARPDVAAEYNNYCVECLPSYYAEKEYVYTIPVRPSFAQTSSRSSHRAPMGLAFNGVNFDPPAPTEAILRAHTIAPLDDCGGHVNPATGYHYHAVTGCTKEIAQEDQHAPMIGYAMDGFGIFALLDTEGNTPEGLDECRGHSDSIRGYHYHVGSAGDNQIIPCLKGAIGIFEVSENGR